MAMQRLGVACLIALGLAIATPAWSQFTSFSSHSNSILEGNWQSCVGENGEYAERVFTHKVEGEPVYEVHLGPENEFAIFKGTSTTHRPHDSPDNLLKPYQVPMRGQDARYHWSIPSLNLSFDVAAAGGSRRECLSWYIVLTPLKPASR
jgi:hypothetical protein